MEEILENIETNEIEMPPQRKNQFCVISKDTVEVVDINGKKTLFTHGRNKQLVE